MSYHLLAARPQTTTLMIHASAYVKCLGCGVSMCHITGFVYDVRLLH